MGRKSKAEQFGLKEIIAEKWDGGKNTIVFVTEEVNTWLVDNGYKVMISREGIRRTIKTHEEGVADTKKSIETAKAMAELLKDYPATEASEAMLMQIASLITQDLRNIDSINFIDPADMVHAAAKIATSQLKLSHYRTRAIAELEKAKNKIKKELQDAIQNDPRLLERLIKIVDTAKVA